jgi:tryptophanyl-tRNA synthetase
MGYGEAKQQLFEVMNRELTPFRNRYNELMADKTVIDRILAEGSQRVRPMAAQLVARLRKAVGMA